MLWFVLIVIPLAVARPVYAAVRFARLPRAAKRYYPLALWAKARWRWTARALGLVLMDRHHADRTGGKPKVRHVRVKIRADAYGISAHLKTVPGVDRTKLEDQAAHLANHWKAERVSVTQTAPGRLTVRALRRDPLLYPLTLADAPASILALPVHGLARP